MWPPPRGIVAQVWLLRILLVSSARLEFSVVVPTFGRTERLTECLAALARLDWPTADFEVIVVDDGGREPLDPVTERFRHKLQLRLVTEAHRGPAAARNAGAVVARGRWVAFTDDDCAPAPDWLRQFHVACSQWPDRLLGGHTVNALQDQLCPAASQLLVDYLHDSLNGNLARARFFASCNLAAPAARFREMGGFSTSFSTAGGEDRDLCARWLDRGLSLAYVPDALVHHRHRLSLAGFWRQHANYGRGAFLFHQARRRAAPSSSRLQPFLFYSRLVAYPISRDAPGAMRLSALLVLSQLATAVGYSRSMLTAMLGRGLSGGGIR